MTKTKIIATIGPASQNITILRKMIINGLDIIRFNFSHGNYTDFSKNLNLIHNLNMKMKRAIKTLADLKGNRIRVRNIKKEIFLNKKKKIILTTKNISSNDRLISFDYKGKLTPIKKGHKIYIDDGKIELETLSVSKSEITTIVKIGGIIKDKKGINMPQSKLEFPAINEEDKKDLLFAIENKFDYIAQSFVRNYKDIEIIKKILNSHKSKAKIIAKIENTEALENIDEIIEISDGIMVARGDLGISIPIYKIPVIQKELISKAREKKKFVIVATQMLESMVENYIPTRAEVNDVANAIFDGANYLMLSEETAIGKYPYQSVEIMNKIINYSEKFLNIYNRNL